MSRVTARHGGRCAACGKQRDVVIVWRSKTYGTECAAKAGVPAHDIRAAVARLHGAPTERPARRRPANRRRSAPVAGEQLLTARLGGGNVLEVLAGAEPGEAVVQLRSDDDRPPRTVATINTTGDLSDPTVRQTLGENVKAHLATESRQHATTEADSQGLDQDGDR